MKARLVPVLAGPGLWVRLDGDSAMRSGCRRPASGGSFGWDDAWLIFVWVGLHLVVISEEFGQSLRVTG